MVRSGAWMMAIGAAVLLLWLVVAKDAEEPRCGFERMSPGDFCSSRKSGPRSYEESKRNASTVASGMLLVGGTLTAGGALLLVGGRVSERLSVPRARMRDRRRSRAAARTPRARLVRKIRSTKVPVATRGCSPREVDALIDRIIAGLENRGPAVRAGASSGGITIRPSFTITSPGLDTAAIDKFFAELDEAMDRL
ncbi:hypothetical protein ACFQU9_21010 [Actinomadura namibiensis]|uniref:Uncharacterized protein n=1 Tax=Actinomadura namibiensis TaxID=182080 RepID=A0A7W3LQU6_ACTNM|nr:hypothetical protein [Actinomadura namibiensis]MBA8952599.1 hypothetical protein [Actinomadura namibiensis]